MIRRVQNNLLSSFKIKLKEKGLKITPQRIVIYTELIESKNHPNATCIFNKVREIFPDMSFDTVNRTLLTFAEIGIVSLVERFSESKRFDPNTKLHHHFRCIKCSRIIDFQHKPFDKIKVPEDSNKRFTVLNKRVVLEGICDKCNRKHSP